MNHVVCKTRCHSLVTAPELNHAVIRGLSRRLQPGTQSWTPRKRNPSLRVKSVREPSFTIAKMGLKKGSVSYKSKKDVKPEPQHVRRLIRMTSAQAGQVAGKKVKAKPAPECL